jgi:hypothetical protein
MLIQGLPEWALPMYAAAWQMYDELRKEPPLTRADVVTVDQQLARETARTALEIIYDYAMHRPKMRAALDGSASPAKERRHIVRSLCLAEMRGAWAAAWRDVPTQERAFNQACRAMGWFKSGKPVALDITEAQATDVGIDLKGRKKATVPGVLLNDQRLAELEAYLLGDTDGGGGGEKTPTNDTKSDIYRRASPARLRKG